MTVEITCASCGRLLTGPCRWGDEADYDRNCVDRKPAVPPGLLVRLNTEGAIDGRRGDGGMERHDCSEAGAIASNPEDIVVDSLHSTGPDNGCCGSDGLDGPNRACLCGAVVATQWSDCWTHAEVRFLPNTVSVSRTA